MTTVNDPKPRRKSQRRGTIFHRVETRTYTRKDGSIGESKIDRWQAHVDVTGTSGKPQRVYLKGASREDVEKQLTKLLHEHDRGRRAPSIIDSARTSVADCLEDWLDDVVKRTRRHNTYLLYSSTVRRQIAPRDKNGIARGRPYLGRLRLTALDRDDVNEWIRELEQTHLAPRTIQRCWAVLHSGLQHAVDSGHLVVNPARKPALPRVDKEEPRALTRDQVQRILEAIAGEPEEALYALELFTGLREGELLGLRWAKDDRSPGVDLKHAQVRVHQQVQHGKLVPLKRDGSRRALDLSPQLVEILRRHQRVHLVELQLKAGQRWQPNDLVFPSQVGTPRDGANLWLSWQRLLKRLGLPAYKFHELRHTAASLAIAEGASLFHVSRMLGHSSISITADIYGHWTAEGRADVAARMGRALFGVAIGDA